MNFLYVVTKIYPASLIFMIHGCYLNNKKNITIKTLKWNDLKYAYKELQIELGIRSMAKF